MAIPEILAGLTGMNMYAEDARVASTPGHSQYLWSRNFQHFFDLKDSVKDPCDSAMPWEGLRPGMSLFHQPLLMLITHRSHAVFRTGPPKSRHLRPSCKHWAGLWEPGNTFCDGIRPSPRVSHSCALSVSDIRDVRPCG